ncbi:hypothetical protein SAMN05421848_1876 [Kushneria avicenniae]|uniref:Uncharacterized protein n=1 Tax=Kushneria avicenniae TaxID=402385 RepID=A0A1I1K7H6_9GAMM|nr:hypothetical protein [Kushneria avicenniae]SFC54003.1 hypothetical protein SAMN05421848_1876 [Kushneria avicenniae]
MSQSAPTNGETQTRLNAKGEDAYHQPADQLFYMVGKDTILAVPSDDMPKLLKEMRLLESVIEAQQNAIDHLKSCQDKYIKIKQANYFRPDKQIMLSESDSAESLENKIIIAQETLDKTNKALIHEIEPLTKLSDNTNHINELIPIQRRGANSSVAGFRMTYVRSEKIKNHWRKYQLTSKKDTVGADNSVLTNGQVDWKKLKNQLSDISGQTSIKTDIPWFDDWMKLEDQNKELFQWSKNINQDLETARSYQSGKDHDVDSIKVDLGAEAQLMRWSYGASGVSGEANPFKKKAAIKASGHAELMLAEAKASIDCYEPPGGYMMAFGDVNLGMLRSHSILSVAGGVGASIAAELNIDAEFSGSGAKARGARGTSRNRGIPGNKTVDMAVPDNSQGGDLGAFIGGQLEATIAGQVEWKSPESKKFEPFAKIAPAVALQGGLGGEATLKISYLGGKFRIFAKAALCYGVGAKGKLTLEVDASLIYEFIKWIAYQLKNINYARLDFIEDSAYEVLSDIIVMAIQYGKNVQNFMLETSGQVREAAFSAINDLQDNLEAAGERGELVQRINSDPDILRHTTPDAKGAILYRLMQKNAFDDFDTANRTTDVSDLNFWRFGYMTNRKRAIINVFTWVQSKEEYHNLMQRITQMTGEKTSFEEGEKKLLNFLGRGELPVFSSNYPENLKKFYMQLRDVANKGDPIYRNDMTEYLTQNDISTDFEKPCFNATQCLPQNNSRIV